MCVEIFGDHFIELICVLFGQFVVCFLPFSGKPITPKKNNIWQKIENRDVFREKRKGAFGTYGLIL